MVLDAEARCSLANKSWQRLIGETGVSPLGLGWLSAIHRDERPAILAAARAGDRGREWSALCRWQGHDHDPRWLHLQAMPIADATGSAAVQIITAVEATAQARADSDRPPRWDYDALTRLPGRAALLDVLRHGLDLTAEGDRTLCLIVLDLDAFAGINDSLGLEAGDKILSRIGGRLSRGVGRMGTVARLAGDQFAVALLDVDHAEDALLVAQRILRVLEQPITVAGERVAVSVSMGIALAPQDGADTPARLLQQADSALQRSKRFHTGIAFFEGGPAHQPLAAHARLAELRGAIRAGQLTLHYQPCLRLRDQSVHCAEALVRWNHPQRGLLPPSEFVPFAESSGLIRELDLAVLEMACTQIASWRGSALERIRVAVNVSRASLLDDRYPASLAATLIRHQLQGHELQLEITESGLFDDTEQASWLAERLSALGVELAIDDFGTGYSSLAQLRNLPARVLKIDRSFVSDAVGQPADAAILETVVTLGHRLGKYVVAEGVEDAATLRLLGELGVDDAQGYAISRPIPPSDLEAWLQDRSRRDAASGRHAGKAIPVMRGQQAAWAAG